ncbi:MAG: histidinol-phosphatase [Erysipelotrichaceae bacterium]|nr:histidinol-phosphatase [Erysipelotrichaceae bacterium]
MENRQLFNYHTHTYRCGHASMEHDEEYVLAAIEAGFKQIGFSDHGPFREFNKPSDRMNYDRMEEYLESIYSLKAKYKNQIDIKVGFEFEYFPDHIDQILDLKERSEYLILGQHYAYPDAGFDYCLGPNNKDTLLKYRDLVCEGMESGHFIYLAHPDYFCASITEFDDVCKEVASDIAKTAVKTDTPLELNIKLRDRKPKHYKNGDYIVYPHRPFWEVIAQYPVKCIYGFDAHDTDQLKRMENYTDCDTIIKGLNLEFIKEPLI